MIDLRIVAARVLTMDPARPETDGLAIDGGRIVEVGPETPANRVIGLNGRWASPGLVLTGVDLGADEASILASQRDLLPKGVTAVHAWTGSAGLRALRSLELGRSLRLRVHAVLVDPEAARLAAFVQSTPPSTATGGFGAGGRLSLRAAGVPVSAGEAAVAAVAAAARASGWQVLLRAAPGEEEAARALLARLDAPAGLRWRVESASPPASIEARTREAAEAGFLPGGMLVPGRVADLVVTAGDPRSGTEPPTAVMMDGRTAFQARGLL